VSAICWIDPVPSSKVPTMPQTVTGRKTSPTRFTTAGGHRVELAEGIWDGSGYKQNLKLINVPVLKYHDTGGSEMTASLKHVYGILSMSDGNSSFRHYGGLGETSGKMMVSVRTPVLNIIDAIWVSHSALAGFRHRHRPANQILASRSCGPRLLGSQIHPLSDQQQPSPLSCPRGL
jgi:hypothetical protein